MNKVKQKAILNSSITTLPSKQHLNITDSKRFVRKREKSNESFGFHRTPKNAQYKPNLKLNEQSSPKLTQTIKSSSFIRNKDFLNVLRNQIKDDEAKQTPSNARQLKKDETFRQKLDNILKKGENVDRNENYEEQLQMKNKEILLLEDENQRMKKKIEQYKKIQKNEQKLFHENKQISSKLKNFQYLNLKLQNQNNRLQSKNSLLKGQCDKIQDKLYNIMVKYEQLLSQKDKYMQYYEKYINKNVPKHFQDIQSCREMSLQKQIAELKQQILLSTSENERNLQKQIQKLSYAFSEEVEKVRSYQIWNRVLKKKLKENQFIFAQNLRLKDENFNLKVKIQTLEEEKMQLRRTNESIRKNIEEKLNRSSKYRKKLIGSESEESLTFSDSSD